MNVFISWSGVRSRFVAESLRTWLPRVLQSVKAWMSEEDISAGSRWLNEISNQLSSARVGIICVTPENQVNPWLLFEAGALSKTLEQTFVCPVLFDLSPSQLVGPLSQFQANEIKHDGIERVVCTLNKAMQEDALASEDIAEIFEVWWPKLSSRLEEIPPAPTDIPQKRSIEDILEEIVTNTREQIRRENIRLEASNERDAKMDGMLGLMRSSFKTLQDRSKIVEESLARELEFEDLISLSKDLPKMGVSEMQKALGSLEEIKLANKSFTEKLLKGSDDNDNNDDKKG